ncbi:MAG: 2-(1,2-epoxy-1,2-dihydrophenyl)acetyl-CoA isomerase [Gemmatimonadales bacterium]|nr:2-(1,2-epoxy-1,2-dihydrophenyl)acetyl-CoA isomerase [Gemmatimonadales bacterium]NIN12419.1 2-(1,2-epoxy-1,2-dihydrophenyl)acetyl-CoA isomerase [Gemmatimonadales bacterium]NIN50795.1 2-(1,2-epoxy-1,2-dihydrophenyl)acetyl-CoA isomerase [Gemmatimonadales bacterium]NIP08259.1 2-(1,2-epoxy-1,2-dihydrophenyl)acetyl-CoA isomerase [Gemmatimonadales bacterium]NIR00783.1 2-(1,2-epoxy-1,2-dihydrophenyl)acetyl-CoA isomerase [Gemmatimonadales bacterium]
MSGFQHVLVSRHNGLGTITLNRPEKLNAFAGLMRQELATAVRQVADSDDIRVVVITGAGRAFCAGADVAYMREVLESEDWEAAEGLVEAGRQVVTTIRSVPKPVIASVNGPAAGGGANLALACDVRIASDRASIGQTFNRIGLHPDWGGMYFLPRLVGPSKALELVFTAEMVDAHEAHRLGLFNRVVPHDELTAETEAFARMLAEKPPIALALAKQAVYESGGRQLSEMLEIELEHQLQCFRSNDASEGLRAFLDKRAPTFHGT